ncbi:hypothetical protein ABEB36_003511 [Hypothenemus hampei]|uniref:Uncharacterized protein n=1 Tax=Hypothenemus hampei TaxID=57062 RepID=A0ABD1FC18_HYPHA
MFRLKLEQLVVGLIIAVLSLVNGNPVPVANPQYHSGGHHRQYGGHGGHGGHHGHGGSGHGGHGHGNYGHGHHGGYGG